MLSNNELVAELRAAYPEVTSGGFVKALAAAFPEFDSDWFRRIPDAYAIRAEEREVDIIEVEVTHPIPRDTMKDLARLWFELDAIEVQVQLYVMNRYGHINTLNLQDWYYELRSNGVPDPDGIADVDGLSAPDQPEAMA